LGLALANDVEESTDWLIIVPGRQSVAQIWPDVPELERIPEVLRSSIWAKAYFVAVRRRTTWVLGLICLTCFASICGVLGHQVAGGIGEILGAITGSVIGIAVFVRVVIEWQAWRSVPEARTALGWPLGADRIDSRPPNEKCSKP
jgi:hypothetical protein